MSTYMSGQSTDYDPCCEECKKDPSECECIKCPICENIAKECDCIAVFGSWFLDIF